MSLEKVIELLNKHKLVEGMVHGQDMPRRDLVETVLHRQHLAELENLLTRLTPVEIGTILTALSVEDARQIWKLIPDERENDVLWELTDELREQLADSHEPVFSESQINAFELVDGKLRQVAVSCRHDLEDIKPIWIDLLKASKAERTYVGSHYGLELPDPGEATDLEVSSRF
ncbi:MAG: magnesium transporter CorA, partial [Gallionellaceae bacterium]|nr:magnesium transporter CorA [Gallionellaceae bacterium]